MRTKEQTPWLRTPAGWRLIAADGGTRADRNITLIARVEPSAALFERPVP